MIYTLSSANKKPLNFGATGFERIIQNVWNLINTFLYEVAYDRTMGIKTDIFDKPADVTAALYSAEIFRVVGDYEPRAKVRAVNLIKIGTDGNMEFEVIIEI